jgi:hypothetical protein
MRQVLMFRINPDAIEERTCSLRDQISPVKASPVLAAHNFEFLAVHKFILTLFSHMGN